MIKKPLYITDKNFTGDTGCSQDYQIGFEDQCGGYCNFLGIGNKKEDSRRTDVLAEVQAKYYPAPSACSTGSEMLPTIKGGIWSTNAVWENAACGSACKYIEQKLPQLRQDLAEAKRKVDSGESKDVAPRYVEAYNTILGQYTGYYNNNCLGTGTAPGSINSDPILQTATPSGSTGTTSLNPAASGSATTTTQATPGTNNTGTGGAAALPASASSFFSKMPKWVWWVAGGVVVLTTVAILMKHKGANAKA
jgi:hypothetical protein